VEFEKTMKKLAWITDVHFDSCSNADKAILALSERVKKLGVDGLLVTGDITVASQLVYTLSAMERVLQFPIYYILGNHDVWFSSFENVHKQMRELSGLSPFLKWLPNVSYTPLSEATCVIGHDGWYDALLGDPMNTNMALNDWNHIIEFRNVGGMANRAAVVAESRKLSHKAASYVMTAIKGATRYYKSIVILTHVPPWAEASWNGSAPATNQSLPFYTSKMMGDMLRDAAKSFPSVSFTVLCGHSHTKRTYQVTSNMICHCGEAEYGSPTPQDVLMVP
jgi:Icc protein